MRRIGVLQTGNENDPEIQRRIAIFVQGLRSSGGEGANLRSIIGWQATIPSAFDVRSRTSGPKARRDLWTSGGLTLLSLKRATRTIPIVFTTVYDPSAAATSQKLWRSPAANYYWVHAGRVLYGREDVGGTEGGGPRAGRGPATLYLAPPTRGEVARTRSAGGAPVGLPLTDAHVLGPARVRTELSGLRRTADGGWFVGPGPNPRDLRLLR